MRCINGPPESGNLHLEKLDIIDIIVGAAVAA